MAMKMVRPAWTFCFGLIWLILGIAALTMHIALGKVVPAIEDFPENLVRGFMVVFGFSELKTLAVSVETESKAALALCNNFLPATCSSLSPDPSVVLGNTTCQQEVDTTTHKNAIAAAFANGLRQIQMVGNDKYFGTPDLASASGNIGDIETEMSKVNGSAQCCVVAPVYCKIYESAEVLDNSYNSIKAEIDKLTTGEEIDTFNDYASKLKYLHILPWTLVLSTLFFGLMWFRNGACCCCSNGSFGHFCLLALPQALLWLVSFICMGIFASIGYAFEPIVLDVQVDSFNGKPTVGTLIDHIQAKFPKFWEIVFLELETGLAQFHTASSLFVIVGIIIISYSCLFCCCRPYDKGDEERDSGLV